jgi:hypothetical protein
MDTGHWTLDIGHRTRRTPDTGRWTRTGRRTWTGGRWTCGRGQGDQGAVGVRTSWYHDTAGQRTVLRWAAHAALGNHDGSAARPPASARDCRLHCQASCWVAPPAAKRRLGALLSSDDFGSSVGRRGGDHPVYGDEWRGCVQVLVGKAGVGGMAGVCDHERGHGGQM